MINKNSVKNVSNQMVVTPVEHTIVKKSDTTVVIKELQEQDKVKVKWNKTFLIVILSVILVIGTVIVLGCLYLFKDVNNLNNIKSSEFTSSMSQTTFNSFDDESDNIRSIENVVNQSLVNQFEDDTIVQNVDYTLKINGTEINAQTFNNLEQDNASSIVTDDSDDYKILNATGTNVIDIYGKSSKVVGDIEGIDITLTSQFVLNDLNSSLMANYDADQQALVFGKRSIEGDPINIQYAFETEFKTYLSETVNNYEDQAAARGLINPDDSNRLSTEIVDGVMNSVVYTNDQGEVFNPEVDNESNPFLDDELNPDYQDVKVSINSNGTNGDYVGNLNFDVKILPQVELKALDFNADNVDNYAYFYNDSYTEHRQTVSTELHNTIQQTIDNYFKDSLSPKGEDTFEFSLGEDLAIDNIEKPHLSTDDEDQKAMDYYKAYNNTFELQPVSIFDASDSLSVNNSTDPTNISLFYTTHDRTNPTKVDNYKVYVMDPSYNLNSIKSTNLEYELSGDITDGDNLQNTIKTDIFKIITQQVDVDIQDTIFNNSNNLFTNGTDSSIPWIFDYCIDDLDFNFDDFPEGKYEAGNYTVAVTPNYSYIHRGRSQLFTGEAIFQINLKEKSADLSTFNPGRTKYYADHYSVSSNQGLWVSNFRSYIVLDLSWQMTLETSNIDKDVKDDIFVSTDQYYDENGLPDYFIVFVDLSVSAPWAYNSSTFSLKVNGENTDPASPGII